MACSNPHLITQPVTDHPASATLRRSASPFISLFRLNPSTDRWPHTPIASADFAAGLLNPYFRDLTDPIPPSTCARSETSLSLILPATCHFALPRGASPTWDTPISFNSVTLASLQPARSYAYAFGALPNSAW